MENIKFIDFQLVKVDNFTKIKQFTCVSVCISSRFHVRTSFKSNLKEKRNSIREMDTTVEHEEVNFDKVLVKQAFNQFSMCFSFISKGSMNYTETSYASPEVEMGDADASQDYLDGK